MADDLTALEKALDQIEILQQAGNSWIATNLHAIQLVERVQQLLPGARAAALVDKDLVDAIDALQDSTTAKLQQLKGAPPSGSVHATRFDADLATFRKELERAAATKP